MAKYRVVKRRNLGELESVVEKNLNNGWTLVGGICAVQEYVGGMSMNYIYYLQAMVMEKDNA